MQNKEQKYMDDDQLIGALRARGTEEYNEALAQIKERQRPNLKYILSNTSWYLRRSPEERKEIFAQIFVRVLIAVVRAVENPNWQLRNARFNTYFYQCLRNAVIQYPRPNPPGPSINDPAIHNWSPETDWSDRILVQQAFEILEKTNPHCVACLKLKYFEDKTPEIIAAELGLKVEAFKKMLPQCRKALRDIIDRLGGNS